MVGIKPTLRSFEDDIRTFAGGDRFEMTERIAEPVRGGTVVRQFFGFSQAQNCRVGFMLTIAPSPLSHTVIKAEQRT